MSPLDLVGPVEVAELCGVQQVTVYRWKRDGVLPAPDAYLRRGPVWLRETIEAWMNKTGRKL